MRRIGQILFAALIAVPAGAERNLMIPPQGAWLGASANRPENRWDLSDNIATHESLIGRQLDITHSYHKPDEVGLTNDEKNLSAGGRIPLVSWKPAAQWPNAGGSNATVNAKIDQFANSIKSVAPRPIMLVIWHEPENDLSDINTPQAYVAMWRNVRHRFDAIGVPNVIWCQVMMSWKGHYDLQDDLYPGDAYVDWVMYDCYNPLAKTWVETIGTFYQWLNDNSAPGHMYNSHPWGIAEYGSAELEGDPDFKANWFTEAKSQMSSYPQLKAYVYWDSTGTDRDYHIDTSPQSLAAYTDMAAAPYLNQSHNILPQTPFGGQARQIPGKVQAEDFDNGGEFISFHDTTTGNSGNAYRQTDVDIQTCAEGGFNVGWTAAGECLEYTATVSYTGRYDLLVRTASTYSGKSFHVECDGTNFTGPVAVPLTGGWQSWQTVLVPHIYLSKGSHTVRFVFDTDKINLNWFSFVPNPDINADGYVNIYDLRLLCSFWLNAECNFETSCQRADIYFDAKIDMNDIAQISQDYNSTFD